MRIIRYLWGGIFFLVFPLVHQASASDMVDEIGSISIITDPSLAMPVTRIIENYTREKHKAVSASFQSAAQQEAEVSEGASYDVLVTARLRLIEALKLKGLVDIYSEAMIAKNGLVLVASQDNTIQLSITQDFPLAEMINSFHWQPRLVLGNPETLLMGSVARESLRYYGVLEDLEPYIIYEKELPEIVRMVKEQGHLAMVYESDAKEYPELRMVDYIPEDSHQPVVYTAVVLAGDRMDEARQFVDYLKQSQSQQVLESFGFSKP